MISKNNGAAVSGSSWTMLGFQKNESPPSPVAHVNTAPIPAGHENRRTPRRSTEPRGQDRMWARRGRDDAIQLRTAGVLVTKTHRGTPCLLSGEPGQNKFSIDTIISILIVDIMYEICEYITLGRFQVNRKKNECCTMLFICVYAFSMFFAFRWTSIEIN